MRISGSRPNSTGSTRNAAEHRIDSLAGRSRSRPTPPTIRPAPIPAGMKQRLGIADALIKEPSILILDEPTTSIDPEGVAEMLGLIRSLADDHGVTILLSSHLLHQVQAVCDRVAIFVRGTVVAQGAPHELATESKGPEEVEVHVGADEARGPGGSGQPEVPAEPPTRTHPPQLSRSRSSAATPTSWFRRSSKPGFRSPASAGSRRISMRSTGATSTPRRSGQVTEATDSCVAERNTPTQTGFGTGWRVVARKEFADHLLSARFLVLDRDPRRSPPRRRCSRHRAGSGRWLPTPRASRHLFLKLFTVDDRPGAVPARRVHRLSGPVARNHVWLRRHQRRALAGDSSQAAGPTDSPRRSRHSASSSAAWPSSL